MSEPEGTPTENQRTNNTSKFTGIHTQRHYSQTVVLCVKCVLICQ